ncbi:uncharacterized protein LOC119675787 [Teleopsis dalmanni]|uniref:uncharacterized protein LOC119675787 n=1 Tax=Teleopsis dalmanni TaxID=139649 RepID=UPI0018CDFFC0|nr:uncharacterized protein LOC119675787 [Teleopsis dalmanni]
MSEPPDRGKHSGQLFFNTDATKTLKYYSQGPKYMVMSRINSNDSLMNVSPFLIKKVIDNVCGSEIENCKKLRNGTLLIKTKTVTQAANLIKLTSLNNFIEVNVTEHNSLNCSKGVFYSNDLREIPEEEILAELKHQNIIELKKILKKVNEELKETGLIIATFASPTLPDEIKIGYQIVHIRPYIPLPLRCRNCTRLGHTATHCKNSKLCVNCGLADYNCSKTNEKCLNEVTCINCKENLVSDYKHSAINRICPTFIKHKEIQAIITLQKTDRKTAHKIYTERHQNGNTSYAATIQVTNDNNANTKNDINTITKDLSPQPSSSRHLISYKDIVHTTSTANIISKINPIISNITSETNTTANLSHLSHITPDNKVKIFPTSISNRLKTQLKAKSKKNNKLKSDIIVKKDNTSVRPNSESVKDPSMDFN